MIGMFKYWWHHGLISDETLESGLKVCPGTSLIHPSPECQKIMDKATEEQGNIDVYSIYTPPCEKGTPYARGLERSRRVSSFFAIQFYLSHPETKLTMILMHGWVVQPLMLPPYDPCTAFYSTNYLNTPEVQRAMHANVSGIIEYPWVMCKSVLFCIVPHI